MKIQLEALRAKKTPKPKIEEVKDDVSSGSDVEDYQFECSDVSSEDDERGPSKKAKPKVASSSKTKEIEEDGGVLMKKREEERKLFDVEAEEAKRKRAEKEEERRKLEQELDSKDAEFEKKMENIRKKNSIDRYF